MFSRNSILIPIYAFLIAWFATYEIKTIFDYMTKAPTNSLAIKHATNWTIKFMKNVMCS